MALIGESGESLQMSHSQILKVGVIGLGVGERHIDGYAQDKRCKVVALSDFDGNKLAEVGCRHPGTPLFEDANAVLNDPEIDIVSIASFDNFHYEQIIQAINNGKHVFVEKPLCLFENEFIAIKKALENNPAIRMSSNLILRQAPRFIELRRRILNGELGQIYYIEGDYDYGRLHKLTESWRGNIPYYSVVHGGAIHLIDLITWIVDVSPNEVFAYGNQISSAGSAFKFNDLVVALLHFENGLVAKVGANFGSVTPHGHKLSVYGTKGTFIHGHHGAGYFRSRDPKIPSEPVLDLYPGVSKGDIIPGFIKYILDGERPSVTEKEVLEAMGIALAIEKSVAEHRPITL